MDSSNKRDLRLEQLMPLICESLEAGKTVRFSPHGVSMLPMLRQGRDSVELSPIRGRLSKYDLPLYRRENGQYVLHRVIRAGETYTCMGDNQFAPEPGLEHAQMLAVVSAFYRGERRHEADELGYRLYCRVWYHSRHIRKFARRVIGKLRRCFK